MAETTPTASSAHLVQGNSSASRPGAHMPIQYADEESDRAVWDWITDMTPTKADLAKFAAIVALLVLGTTVLIGVTS
jgi:hypothetical protein